MKVIGPSYPSGKSNLKAASWGGSFFSVGLPSPQYIDSFMFQL